MATRTETITTRSSDLSDVELPKDAPRVKITLTVDGTPERAELDLSTDELETLRVVLKPYWDAVQVAKGNAPTGSGSNEANQAMRQWAIKTAELAGGEYVFNGEVLKAPAPRGALSKSWKDAYTMAHEFETRSAATEDEPTEEVPVTEEVKGKGKGK